jgi:predicted RNase H-like HicB family nuclease
MPKIYDLYVESGPRMQKTMVHVPSLAGCIARGDTTDAALDATPEAIANYLRFLARHGESVDPERRISTRVAMHITEGGWLGNGSVFLPTDERPLKLPEASALMDRLARLHDGLRELTAGMSTRQLAARPAKGRPIATILDHICGEGGYLRGVSGASRIQREVEQGRRAPLDALDELLVLERDRLRTMRADERTSVVMRGQQRWTARYAVRRMLEHCWEHYVEIAERMGREP